MGERFLTEDIVIEILLRLPSGSCIGRFRCVCQSWRNLLSDPDFLRRFLTFKNLNDEGTLRVLITGISRGESSSSLSSYKFHYSSRSYKTLGPISGSSSHDLPSSSVLPRTPGDASIVGCCDGIFCIRTSSDSQPCGVPGLILWNPATSETRILPPCFAQHHESFYLQDECEGFGFDPQTKDYKVIRLMRLFYLGRLYVFVGIYSLRNDSWKPRTRDYNYGNIFGSQLLCKRINVSQQRDTTRNEKCYWIEGGVDGRFSELISFDMAREEFAVVRVALPRGRENWFQESCFMSKGVLMVTFGSGKNREIWGLLKCGVAESWTKLLTVRPPGERFCECLEVWKDGIYIGTVGDGMTRPCRFFSFDPATGEIVHDHLEIEGTVPPWHGIEGRFRRIDSVRFHAHTYLPTRASLALAAE